MTAQSVAPRRTIMKTFTIDTDNNITAFPTPDHAEAAVGAGAQAFTSQKQLAELASAWPAERLVEIWNSLPGAEPVKGFRNAKAAARPKSTKKATPAKKAPKAKGSAKAPKATKPKAEGVREGSKTATVLALIQRAKGATLAEIIDATSW